MHCGRLSYGVALREHVDSNRQAIYEDEDDEENMQTPVGIPTVFYMIIILKSKLCLTSFFKVVKHAFLCIFVVCLYPLFFFCFISKLFPLFPLMSRSLYQVPHHLHQPHKKKDSRWSENQLSNPHCLLTLVISSFCGV